MADIQPIGYIKTDFTDKFGIPRQSGMVSGLYGRIVLLPQYRRAEAFKEIDGFSHLWLIWQFSAAAPKWSPTVRPPRLGGNKRVGVFASRSPFRPNNLGLSCVKLERIDYQSDDAPAIIVSGIDMLDGTPIFDIKPYIPMADCITDATPGYTAHTRLHRLKAVFADGVDNMPQGDALQTLIGILEADPRPGYDDEPEKRYGLYYKDLNVIFTVNNGILTVVDIQKRQ